MNDWAEPVRAVPRGLMLLARIALATLALVVVAMLLFGQPRGWSRNTTDSQAKSVLNAASASLAACYEHVFYFTKCTGAAGRAHVVAARTNAITITVRSKSGTHFSLTQMASGGETRHCDRPGHGGCVAPGLW